MTGAERIGLACQPVLKDAVSKPRPSARPAEPLEAAVKATKAPRALTAPRPPSAGSEAPAGVDILDLKAMDCRWVIAGEKEHARYCGARTPDIKASYCARPAAMAYAGTPTRGERRVGAELRKRRVVS